MKKYLLSIVLLSLVVTQAFAQASGEITTKGVIYPRYTDGNRPVAPLTNGTMIFNTSQNAHQYWNGSSWTTASTPGSGGGPWSVVGSTINNNTGNRVGINSNNPVADLEVQGDGGLVVSAPYTVTTSPPTNTYTMPYNGTLATITDNAGRILDPGGNGNFTTNTNYASYIQLQPTVGVPGFRFTFESLDLGGSYIIFSKSADVNNARDYILTISSSSNYAIGRPFNLSGCCFYIHCGIISGGRVGAGFQLLFESLVNSTLTSSKFYSEAIGAGLSFNNSIGSFSSGSYSRASGEFSTAMGYNSTASGRFSTAMGRGNTNGKDYSFSIGSYDDTRPKNDKGSQMKMHFYEFQFLTGASDDVTITDGQITTSNSLSVYGTRNRTFGPFGYVNSGGAGVFGGSTTQPVAIYANGRVLGSEFNAFSDARHKKLLSRSNGASDLALLNQLKVSNYTFIDTVGKGGELQMGFIAQEVEKILPNAVKKLEDYIPNVYAMAERVAFDVTAHTLTVTTKKPHDFLAKDGIRLISLDKEHKVKADIIIDAHTFVVNNWEKAVEKLFVFGKQVNDFRTVDYDRLFTLGISAIQELSRKIDALEKENLLLKAKNEEFSTLKSDLAELKAMLLKAGTVER